MNAQCERLERRRHFTITDLHQGFPGFWYCTLSDGNDNLSVYFDKVNGVEQMTIDGTTYSPAGQISIWGLAGHDHINVFNFAGVTNQAADVDGGFGDDNIQLHQVAGAVWGDVGNDTITLDDCYRGEAHGEEGDDAIYIVGDSWDAIAEGDQGNDLIDARQHAAQDGENGVDLGGGVGNDTLFGSNGIDQLFGDSGNDLLSGQGGSDTLYARDGSTSVNERDTLIGGAGVDVGYGDANDAYYVEYANPDL